ncbi:AAA family ATPase [Vibrio rumoiensis]|uniref:Aerobic cobaltochelatase subunit CobS n=1 Tax=Vibrio rumoiensis 1S-45 TaxID=1188252 RepID=A0A1E5E273_9VIBR|nr:MoxR family ATPase [Vibrio rumoiensis]OEF25533.1 aerobic cobaltochelatase subunit CobS [Vibrio rumoiensis 1S-45]
MVENTTPPTIQVSVREMFGIDSDLWVPAFAEKSDLVPSIDSTYQFDPEVTLAILAGFAFNRRTLIQGMHGTGKSSHIEQVAAKLNWPCLRINLDGHLSRMDLIGKDTISIKEGLQVTEFKPGILPSSLQRPIALVFDEYDAGKPDVMFVIQQLLEQNGKYTSLEHNTAITPHPLFRMFATCNTVGLGNISGLYSGTQILNQSQLDRWNIIANLNYLSPNHETKIILAKAPHLDNEHGHLLIEKMVAMATLTRQGFANGDISTLMSPRTVITWVENLTFFKNIDTAFKYSFLNRCEEMEKPILSEYFLRCFDQEIEDIND